MDKLAKSSAIRSFGTLPPIPPAVPSLGFGQIIIQGVLVASQFKKSPGYTIHHNAMVEFLAAKWEIDVHTLHESVAWPCIAKARKGATFPLQLFISTWISEDTATGIVMKRRKQRQNDNCP